MKSTPQRVLGINCAHDASACLIVDGKIHTAISEERLTRKKHQTGFPCRAIFYCLEAAGIADINSVDCAVMNQYPKTDYEHNLRSLQYANQIIINPSHHLLHAYYAWYASNFDETAILIVDGSGYHYGEYVKRNSPLLGKKPEFSEVDEADAIFVIRNGAIELVEKRWGLWQASDPYFRFPSLGHMFSLASQYIFGSLDSWVHAGKTMGLAPYGDPDALPFRIVKKIDNQLDIDPNWILKLPKRVEDVPVHEVKIYRDIAAKVQKELEEAMLFLVERAYQKTQCPNLCLSGGVALNSVTNGRIICESAFKNVFITPAANDSGIAIGAALYGYYQLNQTIPSVKYESDFHGKSYNDSELLAAIANDPRITYAVEENAAESAAYDIADGKIIGWFEGKSEFGPRALGHRSILCDPRPPFMKDLLNARVKFRESFRPYAASVLSEHTSEYFAIQQPSPYMLLVAPVYPGKRDVIPAVCHVDGTCRIQTIDKNFEGNYRHLIEHFHKITKVPLILNTSFNIRGEPIVESPEHALACFLSSGMDVLYIGNYRIQKIVLSPRHDLDKLDTLIPVLNDGLQMISEKKSQRNGWTESKEMIQTRTGHQVQLDKSLVKAIKLVNGQRTVKEIMAMLNDDAAGELVLLMQKLQQSGLISFLCKNQEAG
ncbi:MAG: carbamoyltransferase [Acidobacteriota bacterium]|nr:carbamoyltransferase [Acidobacteriota bacterium]